MGLPTLLWENDAIHPVLFGRSGLPEDSEILDLLRQDKSNSGLSVPALRERVSASATAATQTLGSLPLPQDGDKEESHPIVAETLERLRAAKAAWGAQN